MRILVAEDERITRSSLVRQLEAWGHAVTAAEDGTAAWSHFLAAEFDLVITDWEMPGLSGVELIERIRSATKPGYVYLILLTSRTDKSDVVRGIEIGADDFVSKPFDREELRVRVLAGERVVRLERALTDQNAALRAATERLHRDLRAAARVQRAMLPRRTIETPRVRTAWTYVPTDELAGDAIGMDLIDGRYLVTYVVDVSGHGVPAALLSVTAMHAMAPAAEGPSLLRAGSGNGSIGSVQAPSVVMAELNRRFSSTDNDGRFLTVILCVLDIQQGRLIFSRAGHPMPIVCRGGASLAMDDAGGLPVGLVDSEQYVDAHLQLEAGDRILLYSDGIIEQTACAEGAQFGVARFESMLISHGATPCARLVDQVVDALAEWAGGRSFADDVSLVCIDWLG